jgi:hypothetical protein
MKHFDNASIRGNKSLCAYDDETPTPMKLL